MDPQSRHSSWRWMSWPFWYWHKIAWPNWFKKDLALACIYGQRLHNGSYFSSQIGSGKKEQEAGWGSNPQSLPPVTLPSVRLCLLKVPQTSPIHQLETKCSNRVYGGHLSFKLLHLLRNKVISRNDIILVWNAAFSFLDFWIVVRSCLLFPSFSALK